MPQDIKVSVIIPNLNSPIIDKTIESILEQETDINYEIIIVGMDKYNLVKNFKDEIKIVETKKPTPPAKARNIGASLAKGEIIFLIDADCIASPKWMDKHIKVHQEFCTDVIVGGGVDFPSKHYLTLSDNISTFHEFMPHIPRQNRDFLPSLNLSIPKKIWLLTDGFNTKYPFPAGEDSEFTFRLYQMNYKLIFEPNAIIIHLPKRNKMLDLINHAYRFGQYSIKSQHSHLKNSLIPHPLNNWLATIFFSPLLSAYIIFKIICLEKLPLRYWHTLPIIYFLKLIWCFGFAFQFRSMKE